MKNEKGKKKKFYKKKNIYKCKIKCKLIKWEKT